MSSEMLALYFGFIGGILGASTIIAIERFVRRRRESESAGAKNAEQATLNQFLKRAKRMDDSIKDSVGHKEFEVKLAEMREKVNSSFEKQFSGLRTDLGSKIDKVEERLMRLEVGGAAPEAGQPGIERSEKPAASGEPEPIRPSVPEPSFESRPKTDVSQLIIGNFDEIDAKSMRRLDAMKTLYKIVCPQITDIKDSNGAYLFNIQGTDWLVHPTPNAPLTHHWERAFPSAESYTRVIQKVTRLARIRPINDQEYKVIQEGSFVVR